MESKMQMVKVVEKMELEKGTLICVRRKWLWFRETIIKERLDDMIFTLFDVNGNILRHWILSQNDSVQKGITIFILGLNFNQQLINSEMKPQQLYPIIFQITRNKLFASCNINRNCASAGFNRTFKGNQENMMSWV